MGQPKDLYNLTQAKNDSKGAIQKNKNTNNATKDKPELLDVLGAEKFL